MSIICPNCIAKNDDKAVSCMVCGEALNRADEALQGTPQITLTHLESGNTVSIPECGGILGRGRGIAPEIFSDKRVSETHCGITITNSECFIEDIGSNGDGTVNGTYIDNVKLPKRTRIKFHNGSKLRIAHLLFDVKVEYSPSEDEAGDHKRVEVIWVIECPVSGARYLVDGPGSRISECGCSSCSGTIDRRRIARIRPKQVEKA